MGDYKLISADSHFVEPPTMWAERMDKKFRDGRNLFVLPTGVGAWRQEQDLDWGLVNEAVRGCLE